MKSGVAGTIPTDSGDAFGSGVHLGSTGCCTIARPSDEQAVTTAQSCSPPAWTARTSSVLFVADLMVILLV